MAAGHANEGPSTGDLYVVQSNIYKPIIAAINGVCLAQGCGIALGSDIRIASSKAEFGWPQAKRGISSVSGPALLSAVVPKNVAFEFLFTGDFVNAQKALELMLVNYVVEPEEVMPKAEEMAHKIIENAPLPIAAIKEASIKGSEMGLEERVKFAGQKRNEVLESEDAKKASWPSPRSARRSGRGGSGFRQFVVSPGEPPTRISWVPLQAWNERMDYHFVLSQTWDGTPTTGQNTDAIALKPGMLMARMGPCSNN